MKGENLKTTIEVKDRKEGDAIKAGLEDPGVRAFVVITGLLNPLTKRAQARILGYVKDHFEEQEESAGG
jgi:O-methyltransferase involved in polyketide biosynthesis